MPHNDITEVDAILPDKFFLNGVSFSLEDALEAIDEVLAVLKGSSDLRPVDGTIRALVGMHGISGKALAKLLNGVS